MTTAAPLLLFPDDRVLAGWGHRLAPLRPRALWVGRLFLHHVEALARVTRGAEQDRIPALILHSLALGKPATLTELSGRLHLPPPVLGGVLRDLAADGLAEADGGGRWRPTEAGQNGRAASLERRRFHFLDRSAAGLPPHFVALTASAVPYAAPPAWSFDPALLLACVARPPEWKRRHGFPSEVQAVVTQGDAASRWRGVVVDRAEQVTAALALVREAEDGSGERLLAYAVDSGVPILTAGAGWREVFPDLTDEASDEAWRDAWRAWCATRGVSAEECASCAVRREGHRLHVTAPGRLRDVVREEETWLLVGSGSVRPAALVELVEG